jgi:hypothetical protein
MQFDFRFLTNEEFARKVADKNCLWFKVNDILTFRTASELDKFIDSQGWLNLEFTKETIRQLRKVVFEEKLINYYLEKTQEIDTVLDIFIRTNSGGEPLSFSDLLMSITTAHWKSDARKEIPDVVEKVFAIGNPGFLIDKDFVLKTCLVLFNDNIKFQVRNFDQSNVIEFEKNWNRIKKSIVETFTLFANFGFNNYNLRAKNAAIPIIHYIYHRQIEGEINSPIRHIEDKKQMRKWLCLSILKGVFGGQSDTVLTGIRKAIRAELADTTKRPLFPLERIKDEFKGNPAKNLSFDDEFINGLLSTQKDAPDCFAILSLMYSHLNFGNQDYHKDHLHPASYFANHKRSNYQTDEEFTFYSDPVNWNGIANLQLLNGTLNQSKLDSSLKDWVQNNNIDLVNQLIPNVSLDIKDFKAFLSERKALLKKQLSKIVG